MDNDAKLDKILAMVQETMLENKEQSKDIEYLRIAMDKQNEISDKHDDNLREHMRRSDALERSTSVLNQELSNQKIEIEEVKQQTGLLYIAKTTTVFAAAASAIYKILSLIFPDITP